MKILKKMKILLLIIIKIKNKFQKFNKINKNLMKFLISKQEKFWRFKHNKDNWKQKYI